MNATQRPQSASQGKKGTGFMAATPNRFSYELKSEDGVLRVLLRGTADHSQVSSLQACVQEVMGQFQKEVVLDLSELVYISTAGLRALLDLHRQVKLRKGSFRTVGATEVIASVLKLTGLDQVLELQS